MLTNVGDLRGFQDNLTQSQGAVLGFIAYEVQKGHSQLPVWCWWGR